MRARILFIGPALLLSAATAWALPTSTQGLADFDVGYTHCEMLYAPMRGHGDEAYAAVWKRRLDSKLKAQLTAARASSEYGVEKKRALARTAKDTSAETAQKVVRECRGVWQETGLAPQNLGP